jgi:hypothetical protein
MATACTYELWEHGQSGEVFAVRLNTEGEITGCCGPLLSNQVLTYQLPAHRYDEDPEDLTWIEEHRENWLPCEFQSPPHY